MPSFASIQALRESIQSGLSPEYTAKMMQAVPDIETVKDRAAYLLEKAKDKVVLDIGCTGQISQGIRKVAKEYHGIDKTSGDWTQVDLDHRPDRMPVHEGIELVICSEMLEHLSNPGWFLVALKKLYPARTIIFTVPNAGSFQVRDKCEMVNSDHVAWYSWYTLQNLLKRAGYEIHASAWYGQSAQAYRNEGIIMVAQT